MKPIFILQLMQKPTLKAKNPNSSFVRQEYKNSESKYPL